MSEPVRLLIQREDGSGEGLWATRTVAPGIFELDNFPISPVDYTSGDLVMAADDGAGHLYITSLAERRFRPKYLDYGEPRIGEMASDELRHFREYVEAAGCRLEGLMAGLCGVAVPLAMDDQAFPELLANAPYPAREATGEDTHA